MVVLVRCVRVTEFAMVIKCGSLVVRIVVIGGLLGVGAFKKG